MPCAWSLNLLPIVVYSGGPQINTNNVKCDDIICWLHGRHGCVHIYNNAFYTEAFKVCKAV